MEKLPSAEKDEALTSEFSTQEVWRMCPRHLWTDVLQTLDVRNCRRLCRVSRGWQEELLAIPARNKGVLHLDIHLNAVRFLRRELPFDCLGSRSTRACDPSCGFSSCDPTALPIKTGKKSGKRGKAAKQMAREPDRQWDVGWWCEFLGVANLALLKTVVYHSSFGGVQLAKFFGTSGTFKHSLVECAKPIQRFIFMNEHVECASAYIRISPDCLNTTLVGTAIGTFEFIRCKVRISSLPPLIGSTPIFAFPRLSLDRSALTEHSLRNTEVIGVFVRADRWVLEACSQPQMLWPFSEQQLQWLGRTLNVAMKNPNNRDAIQSILDSLQTCKNYNGIGLLSGTLIQCGSYHLDRLDCDYVGRYLTLRAMSYAAAVNNERLEEPDAHLHCEPSQFDGTHSTFCGVCMHPQGRK